MIHGWAIYEHKYNARRIMYRIKSIPFGKKCEYRVNTQTYSGG